MAKRPSSKQANIPIGRGGQWLELTITLPSACAESLGETLVGLGSPGVVEESRPGAGHASHGHTSEMARVTAAFPMEQDTERLLREIRQALDAFGSATSSQATLAMQLIDGGGWVEQWKRFYRPFKIGKRLVIRPPWESYDATAGELVLTLNPGQAFGTGLHATTQLCLALLEPMVITHPGARLLDVGCGSGILSLAAVLHGFSGAFGVDLDQLAVWVARGNAQLNELSERVSFTAGSLDAVGDQFAVVVANILLEPILAMLRPFHRVILPGGTVVLSGILTSEIPRLQQRLSAEGWRTVEQVSQEEWAAVVCEEV
jgi:ribosomal protein L11 methyltransferase